MIQPPGPPRPRLGWPELLPEDRRRLSVGIDGRGWVYGTPSISSAPLPEGRRHVLVGRDVQRDGS